MGISYSFYTIENLIFFSLLAISGYIVGATINLKFTKVLHIFLVIVSGLLFYSFISTYQTYFTGNLEYALMSRTVNSMWDGAEKNSPVFGSYGLLALSFLIVLFLNKIDKYEKALILFWIILSIIMLIAFQSRGPFLSAILIFIFSYLYLKRYYKIKILKKRYLIISLLFIFFIFIYFENIINASSLITKYIDRINNIGTESARFELWEQGIHALFNQPFGGKEYILQVGHYKSFLIHNTWLDINYATGIIPLLFILLFIFKHIRYIKSLFSKSQTQDDHIYFIIIGLAILLPTFFEPMIDASYIFLSLLGFYLALLKNYYFFKRRIR
jgi:hypothetical protein